MVFKFFRNGNVELITDRELIRCSRYILVLRKLLWNIEDRNINAKITFVYGFLNINQLYISSVSQVFQK